ncbi:universal stress protein [Dactylosporangium sp. NPDC051485]|uniref:universal stress protein n=1 Tax=Dactylosporangium sp. NPDC051485 TaxID=3154846 RepID=UPI00343E6DFA
MDTDRYPVVVGADGSLAAAGAVRWAADEAARLGRPLQVTHALDAPEPQPDDRATGQIALDAAAEARHWQPGLQVTPVTRPGTPARVLLEESRQATQIVVGGRGTGGFPALLLGSVSFHLAAYADCPVLVVHHAQRWARADSLLPSHGPIVVGADGSGPAHFALQLAFQQAAARHLPLLAIRAYHEHGGGADPAATAFDELGAEVNPWQAKYPHIRVELRAAPGKPAEVLLAAARNAVMLAVGARGQGGFAQLRLGGTAGQVLQYAASPVLIARP